jgi:hypothetical protein
VPETSVGVVAAQVGGIAEALLLTTQLLVQLPPQQTLWMLLW